MKCLIVPQKWNEKKLNNFLLAHIDGLTLNLLYKTLRKKDIRINGKKVSQNEIIHANDKIEVYLSEGALVSKNVPSFSIVYEDKHILLIDKPAGLEVTGNNSLTTLLQKQLSCPTVLPCHRLDRNTLGLVLFAKTEASRDILLKKFRNHEIEKHYVCHVYGIPKEKNKTEIAYLFKDAKKSQVYISASLEKGYQKIITSYSILEVYKDSTCLLDVNLLTGKTHQIRAHLAYLGYPILGDGKYGKNEINKQYNCKSQQLCSYKLKFDFSSDDSSFLSYLAGKEFSIPYHF